MSRRRMAVDTSAEPAAGSPASLRRARRLYAIFLTLLVLIYWAFARAMERVALTPEQLPGGALLPQFFIDIIEFFHPDVLRHFIPVALGAFIAYEAAVNLVYLLYDLPDWRGARHFLRRLRAPGRFFDSPLEVSAETLAAERDDLVRLRVGGPGRVKIPSGQVAVTEINGRSFRIIPSGTHALDSFEYIHAIIDLRRQERNDNKVSLRTSEGFEVTTNLGVTYRVSRGGEDPTPERPFPYDPDAVRKLAYTQVNLGDGKVSDWTGTALNKVRVELARLVSQLTVDDLLQRPDSVLEPHVTIRNAVERNARLTLREDGIELIRVRLGRLKLPDDIANQYIDYWRAYWQAQAYITLMDGHALALEEKEIARAEAELTMIQAIVEGVRRAQQEGHPDSMREMVALRLIEALESLARQAEQDADFVPEQLVPQIQSLRQRLLPRIALGTPPNLSERGGNE